MSNASELRSLLKITSLDSDTFAAALNKGLEAIQSNQVDSVYQTTAALFPLCANSHQLRKSMDIVVSLAQMHAPTHLPEMADAVHDLCDSHKLKETAEDYIDIHAIESRVLPRIHPSQALSDQLSIANGASASKRRFWNPRIQIALEQFGSSAKTEAVFGSR